MENTAVMIVISISSWQSKSNKKQEKKKEKYEGTMNPRHAADHQPTLGQKLAHSPNTGAAVSFWGQKAGGSSLLACTHLAAALQWWVVSFLVSRQLSGSSLKEFSHLTFEFWWFRLFSGFTGSGSSNNWHRLKYSVQFSEAELCKNVTYRIKIHH